MPKTRIDWTDERVELLRATWATRLFSCADIAETLGFGRKEGRNAVIGKLHRLGLCGKMSAVDYRAIALARQAKGAETKRAKSGRQRAETAKAIAEQLAREQILRKPGIAFRQPPQLALVASTPCPAARAEPPFDPYAHLRTERSLHDALAALTRTA